MDSGPWDGICAIKRALGLHQPSWASSWARMGAHLQNPQTFVGLWELSCILYLALQRYSVAFDVPTIALVSSTAGCFLSTGWVCGQGRSCLLVLLGRFFKAHLSWPSLFAGVTYKMRILFQLDKRPAWRTAVQLVPPAFGFGVMPYLSACWALSLWQLSC